MKWGDGGQMASAMNVRSGEGVAGPPMPPPPAVYPVPPPPPPPAGYHPGSQDDARVAYLYQRSHDPEYRAGVVRWSTGDDSAIGVSRPPVLP